MVPDARLDSQYHQVADQVLNSLLDFSPADWGLHPFENASTKLDKFSLIMILKFPNRAYYELKFLILGLCL